MNGNGTYTSAPGFTATLPGTYRWRASYSGDANNPAVSAACNAPNENANITQQRQVPQVGTTASAGGPLGTALTDTATLTDGVAPTGNIIFRLYGPNDASCDNDPIFTSNPIPVNGNGNYTSAPPFTPTAAGTYRWRAFYTGDDINNGVITLCNAPNESAEITPTTPTFATVASAGGAPRHGADRHGDVVGRDDADGNHHVHAVRSQRCHLRERCDLHVDGCGERQRHLHVGAGLHADGGRHLSLARVLQR